MAFSFGAFLAPLVALGCGGEKVGGPVPPSQGGAKARDSIEYPFGPPANLKNAKRRTGPTKKGGVPAKAPGVEVVR
jgi:hypothetical protein